MPNNETGIFENELHPPKQSLHLYNEIKYIWSESMDHEQMHKKHNKVQKIKHIR